MGKHTKFNDSSDESDEVEKRNHKEMKKDKKKEKRDRSRSPHKEQEKSPRRDRYGEKNDLRRREDKDHGRRREYARDDRREDRRDDRRDDRNNWKRDKNERSDRRSDFPRREEKNRLSADEIAAQRKALWGNKKAATEPSSNVTESTSTSSETPSGGKNEKLWSSAIAATGVDTSQASKFMRLMGVKNAPKPAEGAANLSAEKNRQDQMLKDLEKQYAIARETTHMGRGTGFGFGH